MTFSEREICLLMMLSKLLKFLIPSVIFVLPVILKTTVFLINREGSSFADIIDLHFFKRASGFIVYHYPNDWDFYPYQNNKTLRPESRVFWFMNANYATNEIRFKTNLTVIHKEVSRSHDDFITEHFRKYSEPDLSLYGKHFRLSL